MPATLTTVNAITKEIYQGKIQSQLNNEAVAWKRIERSSDGVESQVGGKYVTFPIKVRRNQGLGYRNELEQLQNGGQAGYDSVRVGLHYGYGRLRLSGQVMELADSNYQAFASAMDLEMNGIKDDILKDTNRVIYGDGTGRMAVTTGAVGAGGNTVTVDDTRWLEVGSQIDIVSTAGVVRVADRQVTAINLTTKVVTFSGAASVGAGAATDLVVRQGNFNREPNGLRSIVTATGTLFNVDPTVTAQWAAIVNANGGVNRALSEGLMIQMTDQTRINGATTTLILTSLGVRRAYFNLLTQQRRYTNTQEFAGGVRGLAFNNGREIPVVEDPDAPGNTMYFLDEKSIKIYRDSDWSWLNRDGTIWKWVHDFDAYEAILKQYWEVATQKRNANAVLQDITEG